MTNNGIISLLMGEPIYEREALYMRSNDEIIDLMTQLKDEKGLTLSELARRVKFAKSSLSKYFNKTRVFPLNKLAIFAQELGVTPEYLLGFDTFSVDGNKPTVTAQLNALLHAISEAGQFQAYGGTSPDAMDKEAFENHILFKNALEEALRISKKIKVD